MRRGVVSELDDQGGEIRLDGSDPTLREGLVQSDLFRRERLHLHDLVGAGRGDEVAGDAIRLRRVARPVDDAAALPDAVFELEEVAVEVVQNGVLRRSSGRPQRLPVRKLRYDPRPFLPDRPRRMSEIAAQLRVSKTDPRTFLEARHRPASSAVVARISAR